MLKQINIEGYWYSKSEPQYPHPISNKDKWEGQDKFVNQLINTQFKASKTNYKGWSDCRVCNKMNGSSEFQLDNWKWPEGLLHYIVNHNVKPSQEFIDFINEQ